MAVAVSADPKPVSAGGVTVRCVGDDVVAARDGALEANLGIAARIAGKDAGLWGPDAAAEAAVRLGWLDCATVSRSLVPEIEALRAELAARGVDHVVLAGMGGSSLAPEVIAATYGVELTTLDTTDPGQVSSALSDRLDRTVLVVSSKSGGTIETDSHRRAFEEAFRNVGIDPVERIVVVTDPGSPLQRLATEAGYRVFEADPNVGGRYSALTAFGLVPSGLAGVPIGELLDAAAAIAATLSGDYGNAAVALGAALGGYGAQGHDKVVIADAGSGIKGFGDWAEQLIAESTGKSGRGLLPVVVASPDSPGFDATADTHLVTIGATPPAAGGTAVDGPLGGQFLAWEFATAVAGRLLAIDPFNQPNVQESKDNTKAVLEAAKDGPLPTGQALFTDGPIEVYGDRAHIGDAKDVTGVIDALLAAVPSTGYLAVMAYLDRLHDAATADLRDLLAARIRHPVTFGWAPRFLHSTGQFHKGGPPVGVFLQITGNVAADLAIPGQPFSFGRLQMAQALGDLQALQGRSRPAVRLHLTDRAAGIAALLAAARGESRR
ncbi:MAG TPA: glucose-6-phosphate isomerase [Mycobacteriales bacterium]|nr:glucose-6-phosphate isomerase [Mycobacteriales bacterium]